MAYGLGIAAAERDGETMTTQPLINDAAILKFANEVLNTRHTTLNGLTLKELQRVYVILQLEVLLQDHPDAAVFMCKVCR